VKALAEDLTERMNVNLMNVRKDRTKDRKPKVYDIENFSVSYAYSQIYHRDADITFDMRKKHMGGLGYNFANNPKNVQPFSRQRGCPKARPAADQGFQLLLPAPVLLLPHRYEQGV